MTRPEGTGDRADDPRVVILGSDAILAARPATPVQLAHACLLAGYALAVPGTWGDELIADGCVRSLSSASGTMVLCCCPHVRSRLLARGPELATFMISLVAPPVAAARYMRAVASREIRVHFVGRCPSGSDASIDRWIDPDEFLYLLGERGIDLSAQPIAFEGVIPPDRRRHWSLAGGFPAPDFLWEEGGRRRRVEVEPDVDLATAVVQHLLAPEPGLLDLAPSMRCACSGVVADAPPRTARATLALTEPPRAALPVIDHSVAVELNYPIDITVAVEHPEPERTPPPFRSSGPYPRTSGSFVHRNSQGVAIPSETPQLRRRPTPAGTIRPSPTSVPVSRQSDGRLVPRAYAARRRPTPPGLAAQPDPGTDGPNGDDGGRGAKSPETPPAEESTLAPLDHSQLHSTLGSAAAFEQQGTRV